MEVHQSLPTHYLHNPYMVKEEQPTSAPSTPPNDEISHIMAHRRTSNGSVSTLSSCSTDHRLYTHNRVLSATSNGIQNGRPLTADRKRPYNCNMCSSRFGSKMELEEHQNSHTGQKPFECNMCKARFNRRSTLWNHKRIHSDDKPFECNVCRMTFKWKNSLKCHKEMHQRKNEITGMENDPNEKTLTYATAAKRRLLESHDASGVATSSADSVHNVGPLITTSSSATKKRTKSSMSAARAVAANSTANAAFNPNTLSTVDTFIHSPLQADGFFANQKALTISDHKELDSLLSTTRLSSMLKEDSMFKTNICDDLSGFGNHNVFETKQDVNLFHANPFMMFGAPQLHTTVQSFPLSNGHSAPCGEYFPIQNGNSLQMPLNASSQQSLHVEQQQQYSVNSSQNTEMPMNHNVITFQSHLEPNPLVQPTVDYSIPQNIDYMIGSYPSSTVSNSGVIDVRSSNQQELHYGQASASDGRVVVKVETPDAVQEVPTVSW